MALKIGDKVVYAASSPFSHVKTVHEIVDIKVVTKEDAKSKRFSLGVQKMIEKKGSATLCLTAMAKNNGESYLPVRFFKKVPVSKSGTFMRIGDVEAYRVNVENHRPFFAGHNFVEVHGELYLPTEVIQRQLTDLEWRTMQSKVCTLLVGLK